MSASLKGKSVVVTGSSKGIGKGMARVFARHEAKVLIVARHLNDADATARELSKGGATVSAFAADVTRLSDMEAMAMAAVDRYGGLDVLCANAGIFPQARIEEMSPESWDDVMNTNLKGTFLAIKACVPHLKKSSQGRIIITSSITGPVTGYPGWTHYGATKAAQLGFMRTACIELAKYGITVNAVMPGNIVTEGLEGLGEEYLETMAASIPLKRLGSVDDVGHAVAFLASRESGLYHRPDHHRRWRMAGKSSRNRWRRWPPREPICIRNAVAHRKSTTGHVAADSFDRDHDRQPNERRNSQPMGWEALEQWGDDVARIEPLAGGVANDVWSVRVNGHLAVGRLGARSDADLAWETELLQHLDREGLTVPVRIPTTEGRLCRPNDGGSGCAD